MLIPYEERLGVTPQDETFTEHEVWDFADTNPDQYPLFLHFPYFDLYRKQVIKQADLVLAMHLRGDAFTSELKARNFAYYEPLTVRDSSLSASTQAVMAAEVGQLDLAYDYLGEAALIDLHDLHHNVRDGLHMASLAGAWTALVAGFGGLRLQNGSLSFAPRLPDCAGTARLPRPVPRQPPARRGDGDRSDLPPARRLAAAGKPSRRGDPSVCGHAGHPAHPAHPGGTATHTTTRTGPARAGGARAVRKDADMSGQLPLAVIKLFKCAARSEETGALCPAIPEGRGKLVAGIIQQSPGTILQVRHNRNQ